MIKFVKRVPSKIVVLDFNAEGKDETLRLVQKYLSELLK